jgi:predicted alpha-1,2-mannosidase
MKKLIFAILYAVLSFCSISILMAGSLKQANPVDYVNPLMGSNSTHSLSHGNTYPAIAAPYGMTDWTPMTATDMADGWIYQYSATKITGFKATHEPSPWINDYGDFAIMPITSAKDYKISARSVGFSHSNEQVHPYLYTVKLNKGINVKITPTVRCAVMNITFPKNAKSKYIVIDTAGQNGNFTTLNTNTVSGIATANHGGINKNFGCRFIIKSNSNFKLIKKSKSLALLEFTGSKNSITLNIGTSFISTNQAETNLNREIGNKTFNQVETSTIAAWNKVLSKVSIEGATKSQQTIFYTCLYRTQLFPRIFYEYNTKNEMVHYSPYNGKIEKGLMYADNGFWDTFRTVYPLYTILYPHHDASVIKGWINAYKEGGWFPKWPSPGYRDSMIGTPMVNIITDALFKGTLKNFTKKEINLAYEGCYKDATNTSAGKNYGRRFLKDYIKLGYIPMIPGKTLESTSRTLEFAYNDYCLAQFAKYLGKTKVYNKFINRSNNYKNVFNTATGFFEGKFLNGKFDPDFSPINWGGPANGGGPFTEGSAWQYEFYVPYNIPGLIKLLGGKEKCISKIDQFFDPSNDKFNSKYYSGTIHEEREMVNCKMGQYAQNNQPVHSFIYMYNYVGQQWKTAPLIRQVLNTLYKPNQNGFCGDEDNGEMGAWYVFSAMGFYPTFPGSPTPYYAIGTPLFNKVTLKLDNGKTFTIEAKNNSAKNMYIQSAMLNGKVYSKSWITQNDIMNGGIIIFNMGPKPNKQWGTAPSDRPTAIR